MSKSSEDHLEFTEEELKEMERIHDTFIVGSGNFDVDRLVVFAKKEILSFAEKNRDRIFYGFAIDGNLLCANSTDCFEELLFDTRTSWPEDCSTEDDVFNLKWNTGDWEFLGFAEFDAADGFSADAYDAHYYYVMDLVLAAMKVEGYKGFGPLEIPLGAELSDYARTMDEVVRRLIVEKAFDCLTKTPDFKAVRVEHSY